MQPLEKIRNCRQRIAVVISNSSSNNSSNHSSTTSSKNNTKNNSSKNNGTGREAVHLSWNVAHPLKSFFSDSKLDPTAYGAEFPPSTESTLNPKS